MSARSASIACALSPAGRHPPRRDLPRARRGSRPGAPAEVVPARGGRTRRVMAAAAGSPSPPPSPTPPAPPTAPPAAAPASVAVPVPADAGGPPPPRGGGGVLDRRAVQGWFMAVLGLTYVHHSTCGFGLPALLPQISQDLGLEDFQSALLTSGYSVLYALALTPAGLLADRLPRPQLLAGAATLWTVLTVSEATSSDFVSLMASRAGFAVAQAVQNPVCFTLVPELFPRNRALALAAYNCFMHLGRGLGFAAVGLEAGLSSGVGLDGQQHALLVPLEQLDLSKVSVLYMQGDMVAIAPLYDYSDASQVSPDALAAWRSILLESAAPGFVLAALLLLTLSDPKRPLALLRGFQETIVTGRLPSRVEDDTGVLRGAQDIRRGIVTWRAQFAAWASGEDVRNRRRLRRVALKMGWTKAGALDVLASVDAFEVPRGLAREDAARDITTGAAEVLVGVRRALARGRAEEKVFHQRKSEAEAGSMLGQLAGLGGNRAFLGICAATALVDVGIWSLVAWQAPFYARVYDLPSSVYAPILAAAIPVSGVIGGVGGGLLGDRMSRAGTRKYLTAGATVAAGPVLAASFLAPSYPVSFGLLTVGLMLSEVWRSNAAVIVRTVSPPDIRSTATAVWLTSRNVTAAVGPLSVAALAAQYGLRGAMMVVPAAFVAAGLAFWVTEELVLETYGVEDTESEPETGSESE